MRVATWNLRWAKPGTVRHDLCLERLERSCADVVVTTEDSLHDWPAYPYRLAGASDWGYPVVGDRRKVIAWSKAPWDDEAVGSHDAVRGRLVSGSTNGVNVVGVCIPWQQSHVSSGRRDRSNWEDHRNYLDTLTEVLAERNRDSPTIVAGDFNQRLPRTRQPIDVHAQLVSALDNYEVATAGDFDIGTLIDHIAASGDLVATDVETWPRQDGGVNLSDHSGVAATLVRGHDPD